MASEAEQAAMRRAAALATEVLGRTYPNPAVGAVVLDPAGNAVGEGRHEGPGQPHAEVVALQAAGDRARGGTAVVTLEPCGHHGRTPPCTDALLAAGIARVVYADADPVHPGAAALHDAGVDVEQLDPLPLNEPWRYAETHDRPYVTWKFAASLDGRQAAADGSSRWITGEAARADVHRLRAECDAILVGVGTVLADDPHLTVRTPEGEPAHQPLRVVADTHGRTPSRARVRDSAAPTLVATGADFATGPDGRLDLAALLKYLRGERDVVHVLVEGGPTLAGSLAAQRLVDRVVGYVAPCVLGGAPTIDDAWRLELDGVRTIGGDVRLTLRSR